MMVASISAVLCEGIATDKLFLRSGIFGLDPTPSLSIEDALRAGSNYRLPSE